MLFFNAACHNIGHTRAEFTRTSRIRRVNSVCKNYDCYLVIKIHNDRRPSISRMAYGPGAAEEIATESGTLTAVVPTERPADFRIVV